MNSFQNYGALARALLGMRGRIRLSAEGCTWSAQVYLDFMKVVRGLVTLRLLRQYTQDIEEKCHVYKFVKVVLSVVQHGSSAGGARAYSGLPRVSGATFRKYVFMCFYASFI